MFKGGFFVIVVTVSEWKKKLAILLSILLLVAVLSIGLSYYRSTTASMELEEVFENPVVSEQQLIEVEAVEEPGETAEIIDVDDNECELEEEKDEDFEEEQNLEKEFDEEEPIEKGLWQKIKDKFGK